MKIEIVFPKEMSAISVSGDTEFTINDKRIITVPYPILQPKQKIQWKVQAKAVYPGKARVKIYGTSEYVKRRYSEEVSTHVY